MPFQVSPGVNVSEIDATTGVPAVSTTEAGMAGVFRWGPVGQRTLVTSEPDLAYKFHKPSNFNAETWFVAANFLNYSGALQLVRVTSGKSAAAVFSGQTAPNTATMSVNNKEHYESGSITFSANIAYIAKYPGDLGNSLRVSVCDSADAWNKSLALISNVDTISTTSNVAISVGASVATVSIGFTANGTQAVANTQAHALAGALAAGDNIKVGNSSIGEQYIKIASVGTVTGNSTIATFQLSLASPYRLHTAWSANTINRFWEFNGLVDAAPGTSNYVTNFGNTSAVDEIHAVIVDELGSFTGSPGTILEVFDGLSRATNAKKDDGSTNYYKNVINDTSRFIWWTNDSSTAVSNTALNIASASTTAPASYQMTGGADGDDESTIALAKIAPGYDLLADASAVDISFVLAGSARSADGTTHVNYLLDNIAEVRKDCVVFASPNKAAVVNNVGGEAEACVQFSNALRASSYGFLDSGYKYQYDKYNDIYRWIPLNGDIAGIWARTDVTNDPWFSGAGLNRGHVKNATKLAWSPNKAQRDILSKASVNAVIREPGEGTVLFDDRTLLKKTSAFRALNVRRLFIVLEKAIAQDAKYMLFEFNDDFTRSQFRNRTVPYLRDIKGRRGIIEFQVVCDETNNTPDIVDAEEFVGDIYIKPNRAIRGIQLNFVAVRGSVSFNEIVGQF